MAFLAWGLSFGFAFGAWREWAATEHPSRAGLVLVVLLAVFCAWRAGRKGVSATATAVAVASAEAVSSSSSAVTLQVVNLPAGPSPVRWAGLDGAGWLEDGPTSLEARGAPLYELGDDVDELELSDVQHAYELVRERHDSAED